MYLMYKMQVKKVYVGLMKKSIKKDAITITSTHSDTKILLIYITTKMHKTMETELRTFKQFLETLFLAIKVCSGFTTDVSMCSASSVLALRRTSLL